MYIYKYMTFVRYYEIAPLYIPTTNEWYVFFFNYISEDEKRYFSIILISFNYKAACGFSLFFNILIYFFSVLRFLVYVSHPVYAAHTQCSMQKFQLSDPMIGSPGNQPPSLDAF